MKDNQTTGVNLEKDEFISTESSPNEKTKAPHSDSGGDIYGVRFFSTVIQSLEDHFSFSVLLVSVVGYIIISAFGQMSSFLQFFGYLFFLITILLFYKSSQFKNILKNINKFFLIGFMILLVVIVLYFLVHFYRESLIGFLLIIVDFLNKI